jgi:hypothetical protein
MNSLEALILRVQMKITKQKPECIVLRFGSESQHYLAKYVLANICSA